MSTIYLDNAATTKVRKEVADSISLVIQNEYGNPSSTHSYGRSSKALVELSRKEIADILNVKSSEIIFTSGGTEGDNMIIRNCVNNLGVTHIVSSKIEHHAVTHTIDNLLLSKNIKVSYVEVFENGDINLDDLKDILKDTTDKTLVSLMHINNEIGNITDINAVADICKTYDALFHSDTVQSVGHYDLDFEKIKVDFFVASAHKFHGPKGVGFAFVRQNSNLGPYITGGMQEKGLRAGTESVHNIVGMSEALKISINNLAAEKKYITGLKTYFIDEIENKIKNVKVIILEGILALYNSDIRNLMSMKIFVDTPSDVRLLRRIKRDVNKRARSIESVTEQYNNTVKPMFLKFVKPTKDYADLIVPNGGKHKISIDAIVTNIKKHYI